MQRLYLLQSHFLVLAIVSQAIQKVTFYLHILTCIPYSLEVSALLLVWSILSWFLCSMEDRGLVLPYNTASQLLIMVFPLTYTRKHICQNETEWSRSSVFSLVYMWVYVSLLRHNYFNIQFEAYYLNILGICFLLLFLLALDDLVYFLVYWFFLLECQILHMKNYREFEV